MIDICFYLMVFGLVLAAAGLFTIIVIELIFGGK